VAPDLAGQINTFVAVTGVVVDRLRPRFPWIDSEFVESALVEQLGLDDRSTLLDLNLTADQVASTTEAFIAANPRSDELETVTLPRSILPPTIRRPLDEQTVKTLGEIWRIHKNDADPFPSSPHAHNLRSNLKLHLGNGRLFKRRVPIDQVSKKDLEHLRELIKCRPLPPLDI
jgi:hypothetical protein